MSRVQAANWDISLGFAGLSLGRYILHATSESDEEAPDAIDHVGLKVFGNLYEYGDLGILTTPVGDIDDEHLKSKYPAFSLRNVEDIGTTDKTQEEFEEWVKEMNEGEFQGSSYDVVNKSCVCWGIVAAKFLNTTSPYPQNWDRVVAWAEKNKSVTSLFGQAGLGSRHLQHSIADQPHKIKAKAKRLYRKIRPKRSLNDGDTQEAEHEEEEDNDGDKDSSSSSSSSS